MIRAQIIGTGSYVPDQVVTNDDLAKIIDTSDEWITERTGIKERRKAAPEQTTSDLAVRAAVRALEMASTKADELDIIIVGTITPDMPMPACASFIQAKLGAKKAFAFDLSAACAGSLYAMSIACQYIQTGAAKRVLVVGAELLSRIVNWSDRGTCVLFGDAAGAMVLAPSSDPTRGILSTHLHTDGTAADILCIPGGGSKMPMSETVLAERLNTIAMNGREVYKFAVRALTDALQEAFDANSVAVDSVSHVIAHQANVRIVNAVLERVNIPAEKCWLNIHKYGNTSAASLPMSLDEANRAGHLKQGDLIAMMAIGAGMSWGSAMVRW